MRFPNYLNLVVESMCVFVCVFVYFWPTWGKSKNIRPVLRSLNISLSLLF